jgi:ketosteroid isomerase-like protein
MRKKNGFNIMLFVFITILFMNLSCNEKKVPGDASILLKTDTDFSDLSVKKGMFSAFLFYIADDGVILRDNSYPEKGKDALAKRYSGKSDSSFVLSWEPLKASIAGSGEIGYTYGIWTNTEKASGAISKGTYITIWKKQKDGSWKFILDSGTSGLPEKKPAEN